jgi:O-antigen/teichoic acid export membrane protein
MKPQIPPARAIGPRQFDKAFVQTFTANSLGLVLGTVTGILAARILGPLGRGELATIFYYPTILAHFGMLGIPEATAFEVSRRREDEGQLLRAGFSLAVILAIPQVILGIMFVQFVLPGDKAHLLGTIQLFMIFPLPAYCIWVLLGVDQGSFRFARFSILGLMPITIYTAVMIAFWLMGIADAVTFTIANLNAYVLALLIRLKLSYRVLTAALPIWADIKCLFFRGLSLHLAQLGLIGQNGTDMLVLVSLLPSDQVGLYAAALSLAWGQVASANAFSQVGFVKVAGEANKAVAKTNLLSQFHIAQVASLVLVGIFLLVTPYVMLYAFGPAFMPAVPTAYWLIVALCISGLTRLLDTGFRALNRSWVSGFGYCVGVAVMIGGALWLVPTGGILAMGKVRFVAACTVLAIYCTALLALEDTSVQQLWGLRLDAARLLYSRLRVLVGS